MDAADFKGAPLPGQVVVVERSAVSAFATAIGDGNPVFHDATAATDAGFSAMPAPPTFPFVMHTFGAFRELQPPADDTSPVTAAIGALMSNGGMILHGEQEFVSHRPVQVGDRLVGTGEIEDVYTKTSGERVMTFVVARTDWTEESTGAPVCTSRMTIIHRR
jgi:acyl dehydratase